MIPPRATQTVQEKCHSSRKREKCHPCNRLNQNIPPLLALVAKFPPTNSATANNYVSVLGTTRKSSQGRHEGRLERNRQAKGDRSAQLHPYSLSLPANSFANTFDIGIPPQSYGHTWAVTLATTYALSPHLLIDGSWGFTRSIEFIVPPLDNVKFGADTMHIPGLNSSDLPARRRHTAVLCQWLYGYGISILIPEL